ncbi:MAG: hypothetical protein JXR44_07365 [Thiotrichales bacterium]|nr:hypothetical protein [Thiotrichales bacterium]
MLCLFRSTRIHPKWNLWAILLSWLAVFLWLEFAFLQKSLLDKMLAGHALLIDLLLGVPLVLAMAIMIYALVYWGIKVGLIYFYPAGVVPIEQPEALDSIQQAQLAEAEAEYGADYWRKTDAKLDSHSPITPSTKTDDKP